MVPSGQMRLYSMGFEDSGGSTVVCSMLLETRDVRQGG